MLGSFFSDYLVPMLQNRVDQVRCDILATSFYVRYWHKADILVAPSNVRFWG
jgi:hypothetical protein